MNSAATLLIGSFVVAWLAQYGLAYWQLHRFYKRVAELRALGTVSIGKAGSSWKRRQYGVLVVAEDGTIVHAEQLSGWTIFASLKPVDQLKGYTLEQLNDDAVELPISKNKKLLLALRDAAKHLREAKGSNVNTARMEDALQ